MNRSGVDIVYFPLKKAHESCVIVENLQIVIART
jgi:hypothetical protein